MNLSEGSGGDADVENRLVGSVVAGEKVGRIERATLMCVHNHV